MTDNHFLRLHLPALSSNPSASWALCTGTWSLGGVLLEKDMSRLVRKQTMWFQNRSDTNQAAQSQKQARSLKFWS